MIKKLLSKGKRRSGVIVIVLDFGTKTLEFETSKKLYWLPIRQTEVKIYSNALLQR